MFSLLLTFYWAEQIVECAASPKIEWFGKPVADTTHARKRDERRTGLATFATSLGSSNRSFSRSGGRRRCEATTMRAASNGAAAAAAA
jgi:hypothetical protein